MSKKQFISISFVFLVVMIIVPFSLEYLVFRNNVYSALSNGEWSGFLGSFLGGIIASIGAIVVVYFSIRENRRLADKTIIATQALNEQNVRVEFANKVIEDVSKYIPNISKYFVQNRQLENLSNDLRNLGRKKADCRDNIKLLEDIDRKIIETKQRMNEIKVDRSEAIQYYYALRMRLDNVPDTENLMSQLKHIHQVQADIYDNNAFFNEIDKLNQLVNIFVKEHKKVKNRIQ